MAPLRDRNRPPPESSEVSQARDQLARRLRHAAIGGGAVVALVGLLVLVGGWWLDIAVLRQPRPSNVAMRAGTALGLLATGLGVISAGLRWPRWVTCGCGILTAVIGAVACGMYILGAPKALIESAIAINIDRDLANPGRIAANTAFGLLLLGCGLILLALNRAASLRQAFGVAVLSVAYVAMIGYLAAGLLATGQYSPQATPMAPLSASAMLVGGFALLLVSVEHGWGRVFAEPLVGGQALRVALPTVLVLFALFAGFHGGYAERGSNWETVGLAVLAVGMILGIIVLASRAQRIDVERAGLATDIERRIAVGGLNPEQTTILLRAQFDEAPNGVVIVGVDWKPLDVNRAFCDMLGYERADLLGVELVDFVVHPADRELARTFCAEHEAGRDDRRSVDVRVRHSDGRTLTSRLSIGVARDERDQPLVRICSFEDVTDQVALQVSLAESQRLYRMVAESASDVVMLVDLFGVIQWVSPSVEPLFGYDPEGLVGRDATTLVSPRDVSIVRDARVRVALGENAVGFEVRFMCADGNYHWVGGKMAPARDGMGAIVGRITSFHDIQKQVDTKVALERSGQLLRRAIDGAPQGMAIIGLDLRFVEVNDTLRNLLGRDEAWFLAHTLPDVLDPDDVEADTLERRQLLDGQSERFVRERRWRREDGTSIWVIHSKALLRDDNGWPLCYVAHVQDNTAAHRDRDELTRRASHDPLTGLINRDELMARVAGLLGRSQLGQTPAMLFCDIDHFKTCNDTFGHAGGDEVLRISALRIASALRSDALAARLGGDEFVVVLGDVSDQAAACHLAERLRRAVSEPLQIGESGGVVTVTMSVGIALATPGISAPRWLRNADTALYEAKRSGRDQIAVFFLGGGLGGIGCRD